MLAQIMDTRRALPGRYMCVVLPSRRNSKKTDLSVWPLLPHLRGWNQNARPAQRINRQSACERMIAGVCLNGRKYKQGDRCGFLHCLAILSKHSWYRRVLVGANTCPRWGDASTTQASAGGMGPPGHT